MTQIKHIGFVDTYENGKISGWTYNPDSITQKIDIKINGITIKKIVADQARPDVAKEGLAPELCGFKIEITPPTLNNPYKLSLHDSHSGAQLTNGELNLEHGKITSNDKNHTPPKISISDYLKILDAFDEKLSNLEIAKEFCRVFKSHSNSKFVAFAYIYVLGRIPDPEGFSGKIRNGFSSQEDRVNMISAMLDTDEFKSKGSIIELSKTIKNKLVN